HRSGGDASSTGVGLVTGSDGRDSRAGRLDIARDLLDERGLSRERLLIPKAPPELDDKAPPVEIPLVIEEVRFHAPLVAAVMRVDPDRHGRAVAERHPRVDAVRG